MPKIHRHTLIVYIEKVIISCFKSINRADSESVESFGML